MFAASAAWGRGLRGSFLPVLPAEQDALELFQAFGLAPDGHRWNVRVPDRDCQLEGGAQHFHGRSPAQIGEHQCTEVEHSVRDLAARTRARKPSGQGPWRQTPCRCRAESSGVLRAFGRALERPYDVGSGNASARRNRRRFTGRARRLGSALRPVDVLLDAALAD